MAGAGMERLTTQSDCQTAGQSDSGSTAGRTVMIYTTRSRAKRPPCAGNNCRTSVDPLSDEQPRSGERVRLSDCPIPRMTILPTRDVDLPLHEDVRKLAAALGRVIRRLEGDEAFQTVETLRRDARARRREEAGADRKSVV